MDAEASLAMAREDIRITMPPNPAYFEGRAQMRELFDGAREMATVAHHCVGRQPDARGRLLSEAPR